MSTDANCEAGERTRGAASRTATFTLALIGGALLLSPSVPAAAPRPKSMAGQWGDRSTMLTITQGAGGRYTIHGNWVGGGDWGTGPVTAVRPLADGMTGAATFDGFIPTLNLELQFTRRPVAMAEDTLVVTAPGMPTMTFRRMPNK